MTAGKATGGWNSNAFLIFDYFSPTDFKFAGIDVSINKIVMGHRTATGWVYDVQAPVPGSLKADTAYQLLLAVNGTNATLSIGGNKSFSYTFAPRVIDGVAYGLNKGFVGLGSNNARGIWDNVAVQVLPPQVTLDYTEGFGETPPATPPLFTGDRSGTWALSVPTGRYIGTASSGATAINTMKLSAAIDPDTWLELTTTVRALTAGTIGGIVFDEYSTTDFKFVGLDVTGGKVLVGHWSPRNGWTVDASIVAPLTLPLALNTDYVLQVTLFGTSVAVTLNGNYVTTWAYNAPVPDGKTGLFTRNGTASFDSFRLRTNDSSFTGTPQQAADLAPSGMATGPPLDDATISSLLAAGTQYWSNLLGPDKVAALADARAVSADLAASLLGDTTGSQIFLDSTAANFGWYVAGSSVYTGGIDALTVVEHELGHVLGFADNDPISSVMWESLAARTVLPPATQVIAGTAAPVTLGKPVAAARAARPTTASSPGQVHSTPAQRIAALRAVRSHARHQRRSRS